MQCVLFLWIFDACIRTLSVTINICTWTRTRFKLFTAWITNQPNGRVKIVKITKKKSESEREMGTLTLTLLQDSDMLETEKNELCEACEYFAGASNKKSIFFLCSNQWKSNLLKWFFVVFFWFDDKLNTQEQWREYKYSAFMVDSSGGKKSARQNWKIECILLKVL